MKAFLTNTLLIGVSLVVALLLAEFAVRLAHVVIPLTLSDRELGLIYRPGAVQRAGNSESGREITVSINSDGFRDDEWHTGSPSILVVGDSFVTAFEVAKEERFTELLAAKLASTTGTSWQILNAGIAGTGPDTYLDRVKKFEPIFHPAYTVVVIYNGNDPQNINYDLTPAGGRKNYVVKDEQVSLHSEFATLKERFTWELKLLMSHSYLVQLINDRLTKARFKASGSVQEVAALPEHCNLTEKDLNNSLTILDSILKQMDTATAHKLIVVSIPDKNQLRTDLPSTCDPYQIEKHLKQEGEALSVPVIAMYDVFKTHTEELYYAGHLNPEGHGLLSEALFTEIERLSPTP